MSWLSQFFINWPLVIPGLCLIAAPIIIHLINRMRYRRVKWAAMEFLLASQQRNRRKLLIEQLLLLLLRVLAVLGIVALIARPFFDPRQLLILQGEKTHHYVVLDDSGSMLSREGETTAFDAALEVVRKISDQGARQPGTQVLSLALLSAPDQPLVTEANLDPAFKQELERKLENLRCTHRALDAAPALQAAAQRLKNPAAGKNLHWISDFRSQDWQQDTALSALMQELQAEGVTLNLIKATPEERSNLAVTELTGSVHVAAANVPIRLKVGIRNYGQQAAESIGLTVKQDGVKLPLSLVIDKLEAGKETTRDFDVIFPAPGKHSVEVSLPADALDADNARYLAVDISDANPVLIIAGDLTSDDSLFLADALAADVKVTGFAPLIESVEFLRRQPLQRYQCIYLLDVPEIPPDGLRALEEYVTQGGGLAWFVGPQVRPAFYSDRLYNKGAGLFAAPLATFADLAVDDTSPGPDFVFEPHAIFEKFQGRENPFVSTVRVSRYFTVAKDWEPPTQVRVIAHLRNKAPIILEHTFGAGRVLTVLTTCGARWNDWPRNPSYVLLQLELEKYIARNDRTLERRLVGEPIEIALDPAVYRNQVEIRPPGTGTPTRLSASPKQAAAPSGDAPPVKPDAPLELVETYRETGEPGVYMVTRYRQDESLDPQWIAYNVPTTESDLSLATNDQLRLRLGSAAKIQIQEFDQFDWIQGEQIGQEIRDLILWVLLAVLVGEQLLAMRLSFHPKTAGVTA